MTYHSIAVIDTQSVWRKNTRMAEEEDERIEPLSHPFFLSLYIFLLLMLSSMEEKKRESLGYTVSPRWFTLFRVRFASSFSASSLAGGSRPLQLHIPGNPRAFCSISMVRILNSQKSFCSLLAHIGIQAHHSP